MVGLQKLGESASVSKEWSSLYLIPSFTWSTNTLLMLRTADVRLHESIAYLSPL